MGLITKAFSARVETITIANELIASVMFVLPSSDWGCKDSEFRILLSKLIRYPSRVFGRLVRAGRFGCDGAKHVTLTPDRFDKYRIRRIVF